MVQQLLSDIFLSWVISHSEKKEVGKFVDFGEKSSFIPDEFLRIL